MDRQFVENIPIVHMIRMRDYLRYKYSIDIIKISTAAIFFFYDEYKDFCIFNHLSYEKEYENYQHNLSEKGIKMYIILCQLRDEIKRLQSMPVQDEDIAREIVQLQTKISYIRGDEDLRSL